MLGAKEALTRQAFPIFERGGFVPEVIPQTRFL